MSFVKLFLGIVFMAAVLFFAFLNLKEEVEISFWPGHASPAMPLVITLFGAYLLGVVTYSIIALARDIRLRGQIRRLRKENQTLLGELHQLRGSSLDDLPLQEDPLAADREGRTS